ncbi:hypothetical protein GO986_20675 [Deinococcus sp. HMF7620]|uniref:Uncharacterized protein n=1 Tax=Deinococcus arboris TaxID=2682977 RepID=A0A7C9HU90_9DEIO|nr:hypothetical protein [Deinococcus arboris]MVN89154.1 hypothetical protein [Deinococcus arboris]
MIGRLGLCVLILVACQPVEGSQETAPLGPDQFHALILQRLSAPEFELIDGAKFYGPLVTEGGSRVYVSPLNREQVLGELSALIEPHVVEMRWGDDYGQYHGTFRLRSDPELEIALATSLLKPKTDTFKDAPEILKTYQSDVLYTPPSVWDEP